MRDAALEKPDRMYNQPLLVMGFDSHDLRKDYLEGILKESGYKGKLIAVDYRTAQTGLIIRLTAQLGTLIAVEDK